MIVTKTRQGDDLHLQSFQPGGRFVQYYFLLLYYNNTNIKIFTIQLLYIGIQHNIIDYYYESNRSRKIMICIL